MEVQRGSWGWGMGWGEVEGELVDEVEEGVEGVHGWSLEGTGGLAY